MQRRILQINLWLGASYFPNYHALEVELFKLSSKQGDLKLMNLAVD